MPEEFLTTFKNTNYKTLADIAQRHPAARSISEQKWVVQSGKKVDRPVKVEDNASTDG